MAQPDTAAREKRGVALSSVVAAVLLAGTKIVVGVTTGSLGILSEAAHSGLDLAAAAMTWWAVRAAADPPDRRHPYGHGKFENLSALFETLLLLGTCLWIVYEATLRLFFKWVPVEVTFWGFAVMAGSIVINHSRARALGRVARKYQSQALEADALHFSSDIWSSWVVIGGLVAVALAQRLGLPWLERADALAALGVAGIVVWVSMKLGKKTVDDLVDAVPEDLPGKVAAAARVDGVLDVRAVRLRRSGPELFVEMTLAVARDASFEKAHDIAHRAEAAVRQELAATDVVVHVEPAPIEGESLLTTSRLLAARHGLGAHAIRIYEQPEGASVELHLEVDDKLRLDEAHDRADRFEAALHEAIPSLRRVVTHLEPTGDGSATCRGASLDDASVGRALDEICARSEPLLFPHEVVVQHVDGALDVSFHCTLAPDTSIVDAHALTERVEKELRARVSHVGRVVIHLEPAADAADAANGGPSDADSGA
ncbi:MAG: cation diffusion facilitator family transporter [Deltaproteobacteria bacterium]|nr:cation diffusion facilitator family transporter [Deltaproteobacteria bacterium]